MPDRDLSRASSDALILDGSTRQALVTTRTLGRLGLRIVGAESADLCDPRFGVPTFASRWSAGDHILPSYHDDATAYAKALLDVVRAHRARVVIPSMDGSIAALRPWRSSFERHNVALALASEAAFDVANDKQRTLAVADELGIPHPRTIPIDRVEDTRAALAEVGVPAVIKPTQSWVSNADLATRVISEAVLNESEALAYVERLHEVGSSMVAQQLVTGPREAVSVFYAKGRVWAKFAQVAHRTTPALGGVSVVRESIPMPADLESAALALVHALDLEGYSEIEFRRDAAGRPFLMEINARLSGSLEVAVRSGVAFPALLWRWAADEPLSPVLDYRTGIKMRHLKGDVKWLRENLTGPGKRPDCVPPKKALAIFAKDFLHRQSYDYVDRTDLRPAFVALAGDVRRARRKSVKSQLGRARGAPEPTNTPTGHDGVEHRRRGDRSRTEWALRGSPPPACGSRAPRVRPHHGCVAIQHARRNAPQVRALRIRPFGARVPASWPATTALRPRRSTTRESSPSRESSSSPTATWFANQLVPEVEETEVVSLTRVPTGGFMLRTATGERIKSSSCRRGHWHHPVRVRASRVVSATFRAGLAHVRALEPGGIPRQGRPRRRRWLLGPRDGGVAPRARSGRQARGPW